MPQEPQEAPAPQWSPDSSVAALRAAGFPDDVIEEAMRTA